MTLPGPLTKMPSPELLPLLPIEDSAQTVSPWTTLSKMAPFEAPESAHMPCFALIVVAGDDIIVGIVGLDAFTPRIVDGDPCNDDVVLAAQVNVRIGCRIVSKLTAVNSRIAGGSALRE